MSVGFAADLLDRDFKRDSWPKTDNCTFFFSFLLWTSLSVSQAPPFGKSTCQLIGVINSLLPCPISKKNTKSRSLPCLEQQYAERRGVLKLLTSLALTRWDSCDEELEAGEEGAEEEGRLQLVRWSTFVHQIYGGSRPKHRSCTKCRICDLS